jgi:acetyl esterase/lipase
MTRKYLGLAGLVLLSAALAASAQQALAQAPSLPEGTKLLRDLAYVPGGHERQKLDLYLPAKAEGKLPVVVWVHGGGWEGGNKDRCPAVPFVPRGYAVASLNYRLSQHAPFPAQIEDCKSAIRWLRAHAAEYHLDPDRFGVWGASAGGHLVALLGTSGGTKELDGQNGNLDQPSRVQAVVDWFGPTDLVKILSGRPGNAEGPVTRLLGGPIADKKDLAIRANPIPYVAKNTPPFLIMHGDKDPTVPYNQSELLAEALQKAGVEVTLVKLEGAGHGGPAFNTPDVRKQIEAFMDKQLKK